MGLMSPESSLALEKHKPIDQEGEMIGVFPLIRKHTGIRIRTAHDKEYAISVIAEADPHINFIFEEGPVIYTISKNQEEILVNAIMDVGIIRWINLVPKEVDVQKLLKKRKNSPKK